MKFPFVLVAFVFTVSAQAQTTLSFTSRGDLASTFGYSNPEDFISKNDKTIGTRASFGFELMRHNSENQALLLGLEYAISGFDFYQELVFFTDINTTTGTIIGDSYLKGSYRYDFISLPVGYRWYRADRKWRLYAQASLLPMAYIRTISSLRLKEDGGIDSGRVTDSERNDDFQTFHLAASTAIGVERTIFKSWTVGLQPTFRVHLTSVTTTEFKERPWTAGLQLNIGRVL